MKQVQKQLPAHRLDFAVVDALRKPLGICKTFIDLNDCRNYKGQRRIEHGRIFLPPNPEGAYIVIDKDHSTRYLVERVVRTAPEGPVKIELEYLRVVEFHGYKFEQNKYLIHGQFQNFEMKSYESYIGFEQVRLDTHKYHKLAQANIFQRNGKGEVLFCKVATQDGIDKYYFDRQLKRILKLNGQLEESRDSNDYFSHDISENTALNLLHIEEVSTLILNYFFDRLIYGYYSRFWFKESDPFRRIKVFHSNKIISFFTCPTETLDFAFFRESLLDLYASMGQCVFADQKLMMFPIYEKNSSHFNLGAILVDEQKIDMFEFDPLDCQSGGWRGRLGLLVKKNAGLLQEKAIVCKIKAQIQTHSSISSIDAPKQQKDPDCAIYICLYALLLMERFGFLQLSQQLKGRCKGDDATKELILFMRRFLYYSYKHRNTYFLPVFNNRFSQAFAYYYYSCS